MDKPNQHHASRRTIGYASSVLLLAVVLGAFGAHGLRDMVDAQAMANWKTGVEYQFYHGLALLFLALVGDRIRGSSLVWARRAFTVGILGFSGSLYLLAMRPVLGTEALTPLLGPITPLGGLMFIVGWAALAVGALRKS
ncbi:MAG: DUF423 domain-containing protein [Flavobacteriales bacterium]|nr:MAG: DUF423 domain-containing protein [Flavobacteriales bacterium]